MNTLIERLEALTAPCRECDRWIALAKQNGETGAYKTPQLWVNAAIRDNWNTPRYTASIDVAMTLVPEGWGFKIEAYDGREVECVVAILNSDGFYVFDFWARAATPAIALCIASLRARDATNA